ncbi:hypothetical protein C7974DRAFT_28442 [Boeremia exigua]|uniref:uncharacterized protein n=1 Tax=Boeremia exigua TaxID=749465 RepID=UPI001E8E7AD2|nr:uncharacterized protein C7974DRAFT_28442 [Boeremia exigua]KAH6644821.1 hypothetical protein C7974DRAFT_28442 [Boeremia exigua]
MNGQSDALDSSTKTRLRNHRSAQIQARVAVQTWNIRHGNINFVNLLRLGLVTIIPVSLFSFSQSRSQTLRKFRLILRLTLRCLWIWQWVDCVGLSGVPTYRRWIRNPETGLEQRSNAVYVRKRKQLARFFIPIDSSQLIPWPMANTSVGFTSRRQTWYL